ncbi:hypothetical protein M2T28_09970 [Elizabethkingia miricola]|uniref:Cytochrome C n=1 Tax=Elizabethkingia miricola TaxID=172045 RepID=A0ABD4DQ31_ELIMR|nr:hypothetical protein [Elizabethkingia miricola]KUY20847.1 hypothetical protein ATB95_08095 [Elizabethkingia miricola]MCL1652940.1 hypothetical protein [Elizabethkingia miricola]
MKRTQLIVSILGLFSVVACTTDREEVNSSPKLNTSTSASVKSIRTLSDTLKINQSHGITTKADSDGGETSVPIDGSEIIPPGEVRPPKK